MNRPIKFRVWKKPYWHAEKPHMVYCDGDPSQRNSNGYFCTGNMFFSWDQDYYAGLSISHHPECDIMQFTGLLDADGKEIYEQDIIAWDIRLNSGSTGSEVKFLGGMFCVEIGDSFIPLENINHVCRIVGNIYEKK